MQPTQSNYYTVCPVNPPHQQATWFLNNLQFVVNVLHWKRIDTAVIMSLILVALLVASNNECVSSYKPALPKFISSKLETLQAQSSKISKVLSSLAVAATLVNSPFSIDQANAVDRYNNKLNAPTAIGTRVNSDAESLLRYGTSSMLSVTNAFSRIK